MPGKVAFFLVSSKHTNKLFLHFPTNREFVLPLHSLDTDLHEEQLELRTVAKQAQSVTIYMPISKPLMQNVLRIHPVTA